MKTPSLLRRTTALAQQMFLTAFPDGGQRVARRNAWAGMSENAVRLRAHSEAETALRAAASRREATGTG